MSAPLVSIIVPVFNRWDLTRRCLELLRASASSSNRSAEIILADDASTDETSRGWQSFAGGPWTIRYHANAGNLGFLRTCNAAARQARGDYLCFLNNDVEVSDGWLDMLIGRLEDDARIGAIGPMFVDESGLILECGGMVHSDGSARQLGHGARPDDRRFQFLNDVDYVSGACLVTRTALFRMLGGFDDRYAPCYYEDTDLCLQIAEQGLRVVVDPRVRIIHREGSSSGSDPSAGPKRYQSVNRELLFAKWRSRLGEHHPSPEEQSPERIRIWRRGGALMCHRGGGSVAIRDEDRFGSLLGQLAARGHHVVGIFEQGVRTRDEALHAMGIETVIATGGDERACRTLIEGYRPRAAYFDDFNAERRAGRAYYTLSPGTVRVVRMGSLTSIDAQAGADGTHVGDAFVGELASGARSDVVVVSTESDRRLLIDQAFLDSARVVIDERSGAEAPGMIDALLEAIARAARGRRDARWRLAQRMLWHERGRPGSLTDFEQEFDRLTRRNSAQKALLEQYAITLERLSEADRQLQRDLAQSRLAEDVRRRR